MSRSCSMTRASRSERSASELDRLNLTCAATRCSTIVRFIPFSFSFVFMCCFCRDGYGTYVQSRISTPGYCFVGQPVVYLLPISETSQSENNV